MDSSYPYIASLTREPFLFYEMRTTARLLSDGHSDEETIEKIYNETFSVSDGKIYKEDGKGLCETLARHGR